MRIPRSPSGPTLLVSLLMGVTFTSLSAAPRDAGSAFQRWFKKYQLGRIDLYEAVESGFAVRDAEGRLRVEYYQSKGIQALDAHLNALVEQGDEDAARLLVQASVYVAHRDPDVERRRYVERQPWLLRHRASVALSRLEGDDVGPYLRRTVLRDESALGGTARRMIACETLGRLGDPAAVADLADRLRDDDAAEVRAAAARGLSLLDAAGARDALIAAIEDEDPTVRLEALLALEHHSILRAEETGEETAESEGTSEDDPNVARLQAARRLLNDPSWSIRHAAVRLLEEYPDPASVPPLLTALLREMPHEEGSRRRVRAAIRSALGRLTGEDFPATHADEWVAWWERHSESFALAEVEALQEIAPEQGSRFFGIPVEADEVVFLVDVSGSMSRPARGGPDGPTRLFVARRELRRCLESLEDGTRFNVILFQDKVLPFRPRPVEKDPSTVAAATAFLDSADPDGGTNLFGALEFALGAGKRAAGSARQLLGDELDTIVLLTDGKPSRGAVLVPDEILHQIRRVNRELRIAVHTVAAGNASPFLEQLARENHGEHTALD